MRKAVLVAAAIVLSLMAAGLVFREPLFNAVASALTADMFVEADNDNFDPGLPVGASLPEVRVLYKGKEISALNSLSGSLGMVLVANRSADWCPYCMQQYVQLQAHHAAFRAAGIEIVALTYDAPELQQMFVDKHAITYPFLSDIDAYTVTALGILNGDYAPGDRAYGIPHPGIFVVTPGGRIVGKVFVDGYEKRVQAGAVLDYALASLNAANRD